MDVITAGIGKSLVPDSLQVPKDSDSNDDDDGDDDDVVVQELEVILTIEGILTECMTRAKQLWRRRRRRRRALPHFYIQQDLVEFAGHGRGEQALWIFHDGAGNFKVSI